MGRYLFLSIMNMKQFLKNLIIAELLILLGCGTDDSTAEAIPPSGLVVTLDESRSREGIITVIATADRANYFEFNFGTTAEYVRSNDGELSYRYSSDGDYVVTVRAHTTAEVFTEATRSVSIEIDNTAEIPGEGYATPESYEGYNLVWQDEFDGDGLSDDWTFEIGTGSNGWGNNELEYYREGNATVSEGYLVIEAREESFGGQEYTSSRIITKGKQTFKYGRIDIRAKLPQGQGIWPALWMLGSNISTVSWPACGEIDIMEMVGGTASDNTVHSTLHWDNAGSHASYGDNYTLSSGIFADQFHVFTTIWDEGKVVSYVDDVKFYEIDITPAELSEFHENYFFIFNVAVGGNWPGPPDASTVFPQQMVVDYIRVFQPE